jgi:hypothetical protein
MAREQFMINVEFIVTEAAKAEFSALGCWLRLTAHCAARILGGRLKDAQAWNDGTCYRMVGVSRAALDELVTADLAGWDGGDLVLDGYDLEGERIWKRMSKGGKDGNKKRWSNRTPTTDPDGTPDGDPDSGEGVGGRIRDSDSVSGESPTGLSLASSADAREGHGDAASAPGQGGEAPPGGSGGGEGRDPRLDPIEEHRAHLRDPGNGRSLVGKWIALFDKEQLTRDQVAVVLVESRRLTGKDVRFPSGFSNALIALRQERRAVQAKLDQERAAADREHADQQAKERTDADRRRSVHQVEQLDAFLQSEAGAEARSAIAADPAAARWLESAHKHAAVGAGANLSLHQLARIHPELERFKHLEAPAPQGSAP